MSDFQLWCENSSTQCKNSLQLCQLSQGYRGGRVSQNSLPNCSKVHFESSVQWTNSPFIKVCREVKCDLDLICEKHFRIIFDYTSTCTIPDYIYHYSLYPHLPSAHNNLGTLLNDTMAAEVHYEAALKITPDHKGAMINLGTSLM